MIRKPDEISVRSCFDGTGLIKITDQQGLFLGPVFNVAAALARHGDFVTIG